MAKSAGTKGEANSVRSQTSGGRGMRLVGIKNINGEKERKKPMTFKRGIGWEPS